MEFNACPIPDALPRSLKAAGPVDPGSAGGVPAAGDGETGDGPSARRDDGFDSDRPATEAGAVPGPGGAWLVFIAPCGVAGQAPGRVRLPVLPPAGPDSVDQQAGRAGCPDRLRR
jgi:hypothetical protein